MVRHQPRRTVAKLQRGPQVHGWVDWQPQPHADGVTAGVRQPQVQEAPVQGLQPQGEFSVFIGIILVDVDRSWSTAQSLGIDPPAVLNFSANLQKRT